MDTNEAVWVCGTLQADDYRLKALLLEGFEPVTLTSSNYNSHRYILLRKLVFKSDFDKYWRMISGY